MTTNSSASSCTELVEVCGKVKMTTNKHNLHQTPTSLLIQFYNLSISIFIIFNYSIIDNSFQLLIIHLFLSLFLLTISYVNNIKPNIISHPAFIFAPIILIEIFHYESGIFNLIIFPNYFDEFIKQFDIFIFGLLPNNMLSKLLPYNFIHQLFHFFYFTFYIMLILPPIIIYSQERKKTYEPNILNYKNLQKYLFVLLFTMLSCFWIFIIFPVIGPTSQHKILFPNNRGMISVINFLFANGDLDGGAFPSSHVAGAFIATIFVFQYIKKLKIYFLIAFILLSISTVYCSFHYGVDVIGGFFAGIIFYLLGNYLFKKLYKLQKTKSVI
ncbi:MAG: phosphatase PAP2 family protein [Candidatus Marinimicrobia bacterium]|nr:phosphatase PAP2 family protein [Candidatus Neomarinimicrobiota bacterium]